MTSLASQIPFFRLCTVFENISISRGKKKLQILMKFFEKCRKEGQQLKQVNPNADVSMFPIVRLFLLNIDRERGPNGLKEKALAILYIKVFCLGKKSPSAQSLLNYREPTRKMNTHDFAERIHCIVKSRLSKASNLSIEDINNFLDTIARQYAANEKQNNEFIKLIQDCTGTEIKWLTRIILKDIKLALGVKRVFEAYHPDADHLFGEKSNLRTVCDTLLNPKFRIDRQISNITVLHPFKPMLLERCAISDIRKFFKDKNTEFIVQNKFDGERSQMHMKDGRFKYYSRHGLDITNNPSYGEFKGSGGFLTDEISKLLNPECHSIILDGELMGWHRETKTFSTKGSDFDVKKLMFTSKHQPCLIVFDIILYNDRFLINETLEERLKMLKTAFVEVEGILLKSKDERVNSIEGIIEVFNKSVDNHEEGIVLKKANSTYKVNTREGSGCYKIKSEYSKELIQDIDVVIIGGHYGEGKFKGMFNSFLVAVSVSSTFGNKFYSICSVSTGLTDENIRELNRKFESHWTKSQPDIVKGPKKSADTPDFWIDPEVSVVLEVRATEMLYTSNHPSGLALRFPRVVRMRRDKPVSDICTLKELWALAKQQGPIQKLTKRHATIDDVLEVPIKVKRERILNPLRKIDQRYLGISPSEVTRISRLFYGKEFCVLNGEERLKKEVILTKKDIERIIIEHSGKIVQNPGKNTFCVIVGDSGGIRVKNVKDSKKYDIVMVKWLLRATEFGNWGKMVDFCPWEMVGFKESTLVKLREDYDDYYDSYEREADEKSLRRSLERISALGDDSEVSKEGIEKLEKELFGGMSRFSLFRTCVGYFTNSDDIRRFEFEFMSGKIRGEIDDTVTDVFVGDEEVGVVELYERISATGNIAIMIIKSQWIHDCFSRGQLLDKKDYILR